MKRLITAVLILTATASYSFEWGANIMYWGHQHGYTNATDLSDLIVLPMEVRNHQQIIEWKIVDPPTKAELQAQDQPTVLAWWADFQKDQQSNIDDLDPVIRGIGKILIQKGVCTKAELIAAIKSEL